MYIKGAVSETIKGYNVVLILILDLVFMTCCMTQKLRELR